MVVSRVLRWMISSRFDHYSSTGETCSLIREVSSFEVVRGPFFIRADMFCSTTGRDQSMAFVYKIVSLTIQQVVTVGPIHKR